MKQWPCVATMLVAFLSTLLLVGDANTTTEPSHEGAGSGFVSGDVDLSGIPAPFVSPITVNTATPLPTVEAASANLIIAGFASTALATAVMGDAALLEPGAGLAAPVMSGIIAAVVTSGGQTSTTSASTASAASFFSGSEGSAPSGSTSGGSASGGSGPGGSGPGGSGPGGDGTPQTSGDQPTVVGDFTTPLQTEALSNVDTVAPEPGTLLLVGSGLLGLGAAARRRMRRR